MAGETQTLAAAVDKLASENRSQELLGDGKPEGIGWYVVIRSDKCAYGH